MSSEHDPKTLHIISHDFYAGYQQATLDFELEYKSQITTFDDIQITAIFIAVAYGNKTDLWKAGYHAVLFAAIYSVPYTWMFGSHVNEFHYGIKGMGRPS